MGKTEAVCRAYLVGQLETLLQNTIGASEPILDLIDKANRGTMKWAGKYPTRRFPKAKK
jgi:hypothetical protein